MNRRTAFILILVFVASIGTVFAEGQQEFPPGPYGRQWGEEEMEGYGEKVTLTGSIVLSKNLPPTIQEADTEYFLFVPRFSLTEIDIEEGQNITVEGYTVPGPPFLELEENQIGLHVTKAIIDGKEYELSELAWHGPMHGRPHRGKPGAPGRPPRGPGQPRW